MLIICYFTKLCSVCSLDHELEFFCFDDTAAQVFRSGDRLGNSLCFVSIHKIDFLYRIE